MAARAEAGAAGPPGGRPGHVQATACSPRGRPHADMARARARGRGEHGRVGPASASGPEVRPRPASAPLSLFYFF